jgi:hypothetical protein
VTDSIIVRKANRASARKNAFLSSLLFMFPLAFVLLRTVLGLLASEYLGHFL